MTMDERRRDVNSDESTDYRKFYDDEQYLLHEVSPAFRETGALEPADFYMMLGLEGQPRKELRTRKIEEDEGQKFCRCGCEHC